MPWGLRRYYGTGGLHYVTWSCYGRKPLLGTAARRDLVLMVLERMRDRYRFAVIGYVVMPEHVHLVIVRTFHWESVDGNSGCEAGRLAAARHARGILRSVLATSFLRFQSMEPTERG
jgi:hypothetical protein